MTNEELESAIAEWASRNGSAYSQRNGNGTVCHTVTLQDSCPPVEARLLADGRARLRCGFELIASRKINNITSWLDRLAGDIKGGECND